MCKHCCCWLVGCASAFALTFDIYLRANKDKKRALAFPVRCGQNLISLFPVSLQLLRVRPYGSLRELLSLHHDNHNHNDDDDAQAPGEGDQEPKGEDDQRSGLGSGLDGGHLDNIQYCVGNDNALKRPFPLIARQIQTYTRAGKESVFNFKVLGSRCSRKRGGKRMIEKTM